MDWTVSGLGPVVGLFINDVELLDYSTWELVTFFYLNIKLKLAI
jgi:hypothetical protein